IGNYIMLELGFPMHIFDKDKIAGGKIIIKRLQKECELEALDGSVVRLAPGDTVVADESAPLVIGGIIGGESSGVTEATKNIFIEVANWYPAEIRRLSSRIGIRTESSQRYEKHLDISLARTTALRAIELVLKLCPKAKIIGKLEYAGIDLKSIPTLTIKTSTERISALLGKDIAEDRVISILENLEFQVKKDGNELAVTVPSFRATKDIECEADIVEEIGRIIGYGSITPRSPVVSLAPVRLSFTKSTERKLEDFFVLRAKALQIQTYPLIGAALLKKAAWDTKNEALILKNPISEDADRMRPSLIPSALHAAALNAKHTTSFKFFEIGRAYLEDSKNFARERFCIAFAYFDSNESKYMQTLNIIEDMCSYLSLPAEFLPMEDLAPTVLSLNWCGLHPIERQTLRVMGKGDGGVFSVHPSLLSELKIDGFLTLAVIDLTSFTERQPTRTLKYKPLSKYPSSTFDCTVICDPHCPAQKVIDAIKTIKEKEIEDVKIATLFRLPNGKKSITVRTRFHNPKQTLKPERIKELEETVVNRLAESGFPLKT
ncbi:MAG: hypothetical protein D6808_07740, partial [Candidatus Dadabacteria bacterium]